MSKLDKQWLNLDHQNSGGLTTADLYSPDGSSLEDQLQQSGLGFGGDYAYAIDDLETYTNQSGVWINRASLVATISAGTFRVGWHLNMRGSVVNKEYRARIVLTDSESTQTVLAEEIYIAPVRAGWTPASGFYVITLPAGSTTVQIQAKVMTAGTIGIREQRLELWRVPQ